MYLSSIFIFHYCARKKEKKKRGKIRRNAGIAGYALRDLLIKEIGSGAISKSLDFLRCSVACRFYGTSPSCIEIVKINC